MQKTNLFLSCDWGTTSFRLKLVDAISGSILSRIIIPDNGIKATHGRWLDHKDRIPKFNFFQLFLINAVQQLADRTHQDLMGLPLILSGMASSSIGMKELPYASLPLALQGNALKKDVIPASPQFPHQTILISGVQKKGDVMRGEEVQSLGWHHLRKDESQKSLLILPGTHSKHIVINENKIVDFQTFMTGELYQLLSTQSILSNSVSKKGEPDFLQYKSSFISGVKTSLGQSALGSLFSIRANDLQGNLSQEAAALYLSGLLIGEEFKGLQSDPKTNIVIACDPKLGALYEAALNVLEKSNPIETIGPDQIEQLVVHGQLEVLKSI